MANHIYPLQIDVLRGEPYLQLPDPHSHIILTPPRLSDVDETVAILNDSRVYNGLSGPPYPYLREHAIDWITNLRTEKEAEWQEILQSPDAKFFRALPVCSIREVKEDGSQQFLGDCTFNRWVGYDIADEEERESLAAENKSKPVGDPSILWTFGDYLAPSHHGQGIMSAAVRYIINEWAIPRLGVKRIRVSAFDSNPASVRVFEKNGFVQVIDQSLRDTVAVASSKGGGTKGMLILVWHKD